MTRLDAVLTDLVDEIRQIDANDPRRVQGIQNVILHAPALHQLTLADRDTLWRAFRLWQADHEGHDFIRVVETIRAHYHE